MNCPKCGQKIIGNRRRCEGCGMDLRAYDKLRRLSNRFYNEGLELAGVRNLTAAADRLKKSLEFNKENIQARNLYGLVLFESGETVEAIVQWVISLNFQKDDNDADRFIKLLHEDAAEYQNYSSALKKYNIALEMIQNRSEDLAVIQLKKAIGINPHYLRAMLLLALLSIKKGEYDHAKKLLKKVLKIDTGNVTARRYIAEIKQQLSAGNEGKDLPEADDDYQGISERKHRKVYEDDKPNFLAFITFFVGIMIGVAVINILAVPGIREKYKNEYEGKQRTVGIEINSLQTEKITLENRIGELNDTIAGLESELTRERNLKTGNIVSFAKLYSEYEAVIRKYEESENKKDIAEIQAFYARSSEFDLSAFEGGEVNDLYGEMQTKLSEIINSVLSETTSK